MIQLAIIIAIVVRFIHACTREGMIFEFVYYWLYDLPEKIKKPLFDCTTCMSPWWGAVIIAILRFTPYELPGNFFHLVLALFIAGGINDVINGFEAKTEKRKCNCGKSKFNLDKENLS